MIFAILTNGIVYQHLSNLRFLLVLIILKLTFPFKSSKLPYEKVSVFHLYREGSLYLESMLKWEARFARYGRVGE